MFARLIRRRKDRTDLFDWTKVSEVGATAFYLLQPEPVSAWVFWAGFPPHLCHKKREKLSASESGRWKAIFCQVFIHRLFLAFSFLLSSPLPEFFNQHQKATAKNQRLKLSRETQQGWRCASEKRCRKCMRTSWVSGCGVSSSDVSTQLWKRSTAVDGQV